MNEVSLGVIPIVPACTFSLFILTEVLPKLGPAFLYEVSVSEGYFYEVLFELNKLPTHSLMPRFNLRMDKTLPGHAWMVCANGKSAYSAGCC